MRICLVASGGGHLRQIQQLKPLYEEHDAFLVTQETPMGKALAREMRTAYLPDVALAKIRKSPGQWRAFAKNFAGSLRILREEKPDLVLSTGAGLAFNLLFLARLLRIRTVFLESIAHVYTPTTTGRIVSKWADAYIVQWEDLHQVRPGSILACPVRSGMEDASLPTNEGGTFVTVGTHGPFPRLIAEVDRLAAAEKLPRPVIVQHPEGAPCPHSDRSFAACSVEEFQNHLADARLVVTHAGTGSIFSALEAKRLTVAIPRLARFGEHYDDHQLEILRKLTELGAVLGGHRVEDLEKLILQSESFKAKSVVYDSSIIQSRIEALIEDWWKS